MASARSGILLALAVGSLAACTSEKALYPPAGSLTLRLVDGGLGEQTSTTPSLQAVRWTLDEATIDIEGFGEHSFLGRTPCYATTNILASTTVANQCGGSTLSLSSREAWTATIRLAFSEMELRRAWRPSLPTGGDHDGDGIPNETDNCPVVPNADQELVSDTSHGVACGVLDPTSGTPSDPDTDADGLADGVDDCVWVADFDQADANGDGIGDACSRTTRLLLDSQPLRFELPAVSFSLETAGLITLAVDFDDTKTLIDCDPGMNVCRLDTSKITVAVR